MYSFLHPHSVLLVTEAFSYPGSFACFQGHLPTLSCFSGSSELMSSSPSCSISCDFHITPFLVFLLESSFKKDLPVVTVVTYMCRPAVGGGGEGSQVWGQAGLHSKACHRKKYDTWDLSIVFSELFHFYTCIFVCVCVCRTDNLWESVLSFCRVGFRI